MCFGMQRFCSLPRRLVRFHHTTIHCFELLFISNLRLSIRFRDAWLSFTRHRGSHRSFQFSCIFKELLSILCRLDQKNKFLSVFAYCVKFWLFFCPLLFFSILSKFTNVCPNFWPYMIWSGSRLNLCQSLPRQHVSFWTLLKKACMNRHSNNRQSSFLACRPDGYEYTW